MASDSDEQTQLCRVQCGHSVTCSCRKGGSGYNIHQRKVKMRSRQVQGVTYELGGKCVHRARMEGNKLPSAVGVSII